MCERLLTDEGVITEVVCGRRDCCLTGEPSVWWFVQGEIVD